jgi:hypothetical protein
MADDKTKRAPQDASRINMNEDYEVRYWTQKFGVTKAQLAAAVKAAGVSAKAVAAYLNKK